MAIKCVTGRHDFFLAACLLGLAVILGVMFHWPLVQASLRGNLTTLLDQKRQERREVQFQGVKTLDLAQAFQAWQEKKALFVDARKADEYQELHVQGAINVPQETWAELNSSELMKMDRMRELVVYCSQESCDDALKLGKKLREVGFERVLAFTGGFRAWDEAGYPADTSR
ncbi:MAG: rhodanese-like domain-containing protein [Deltaproteobacteria bacterium]|nr:rhodanese-like domain-containing protein [Deltaproteobacteria bacterium]